VLQGKSLGAWLQDVLDGIERVQGLETRAKELEETIAEAQSRLRVLEDRLKERQEVMEQVDAFRRAGITLAQLKGWAGILSRIGVEQLETDLRSYGSLRAACEELEGCERKLKASIKSLEDKRAQIEESIANLKNAGVEAIADLRQKSLTELEAMAKGLEDKIRAYGEACNLSQAMARDLPMTVMLHSMADPGAAKEVPPGQALLMLDRIRRWSEATDINPRSRPPEAVAKGNWLYAGWELSLRELLLWLAVTLLPLCEDSGAKQAR